MISENSKKSRKDFGAVVPPRSAEAIERVAQSFRVATETSGIKYFQIVQLYDLLDELVPGASYEVRHCDEMGENYGLTLPRQKLILIREDVFDAACSGDGFGRFTLSHELGHLLMHDGVALQRTSEKPPIYMSSEWQADKFASALLMPANLVNVESSIDEVMATFGVSRSAADVRLSFLLSQKTKGATKKRTW